MSALLHLRDTEVAPGTERRRAARYRVLERCLVWPEGGEGGAAWPAIAHSISRTGIGLALPCPLAVGVVLLVKPCGPMAPPPVRVRVVRSSRVEFLYSHGCELDESLDEAGLRAWLSVPWPAVTTVRG